MIPVLTTSIRSRLGVLDCISTLLLVLLERLVSLRLIMLLVMVPASLALALLLRVV